MYYSTYMKTIITTSRIPSAGVFKLFFISTERQFRNQLQRVVKLPILKSRNLLLYSIFYLCLFLKPYLGFKIGLVVFYRWIM